MASCYKSFNHAIFFYAFNWENRGMNIT